MQFDATIAGLALSVGHEPEANKNGYFMEFVHLTWGGGSKNQTPCPILCSLYCMGD